MDDDRLLYRQEGSYGGAYEPHDLIRDESFVPFGSLATAHRPSIGRALVERALFAVLAAGQPRESCS